LGMPGYENPSVCGARESSYFLHRMVCDSPLCRSTTMSWGQPSARLPSTRGHRHATCGPDSVPQNAALTIDTPPCLPPFPGACGAGRTCVRRAPGLRSEPCHDILKNPPALSYGFLFRLTSHPGAFRGTHASGRGGRRPPRRRPRWWRGAGRPGRGAGPQCSPGGGDPSEETLARVQHGGHAVR